MSAVPVLLACAVVLLIAAGAADDLGLRLASAVLFLALVRALFRQFRPWERQTDAQ